MLLDALLLNQAQILGLTDIIPAKHGASLRGVPILGSDEVVLRYQTDAVLLVNGLGSVGSTAARAGLYRHFKNLGYTFASVIHPSAIIAGDAGLAEGVQIMAGAVIQTGSSIGANTIINTRAGVDHDCVIAEDVHVAPGATLSGMVRIGAGAHIGAGATIVQNVGIGSNAVVGAGAVVLGDIPPERLAVGVPAKIGTKVGT